MRRDFTKPKVLKLFLVTGEVEITPYMDNSYIEKVTNLVRAYNKEGAKNRFKKYYESKTVEYSTYYLVSKVKVHDTI